MNLKSNTLELYGNSAQGIPEDILALSDQPEKIVAYLRDRDLPGGYAGKVRIKQPITPKKEKTDEENLHVGIATSEHGLGPGGAASRSAR